MFCYNVTGLDVNKCTILEMACIITDGQLNIVAEVSISMYLTNFYSFLCRVLIFAFIIQNLF